MIMDVAYDFPVSVIVPVYNVAPYLPRAIESIRHQSLETIEIILVDDGSTDGSGTICDQYAALDARIKVVHQHNQGAPAARNNGIDIAAGRYFYFCDPDDWAEPEMLADMVALADAHTADLVITGFYIDTYYRDDAHETLTISHTRRIYGNSRAFREDAYALFDNNYLYPPWNKLYRAAYIERHGIRFKDTIWDDFPFNLDVIRDIEHVAVSDRCYYHFTRARAESETARYRSGMYAKREEEHAWLKELYRYWQIDDAQSIEVIGRRYIERVIGCIENVTCRSCTLAAPERRTEIREMIGNPNVKAALTVAKPRSLLMRLMLIPIKMRNVTLVYWEGKIVSYIKSRNTKLFARLKARR